MSNLFLIAITIKRKQKKKRVIKIISAVWVQYQITVQIKYNKYVLVTNKI